MSRIELTISLTESTYKCAAIKASEEKLDIPDYIEKVVEDEVNVIKLTGGFKYKSKKIIDSNDEIIKLTRKEELIFTLLIENINSIVPIEEFFKRVWGKGNEKILLCSLRNKIKSIRDKTNKDIIVNVSSKGYYIKNLS